VRVEVHEVRDSAQRRTAFDIRIEVFHREQSIDLAEEFDADDEIATHVLATVGTDPAGTGRLLLRDGYAQIGRMAVLPTFRRHGVGTAIVRHLMAIGHQAGYRRFVLHAQLQALAFYASLGFEPQGPVFVEAGIEHRQMEMVC